MGTKAPNGEAYYYAEGEQVLLRLARHVRALDLDRLADPKLVERVEKLVRATKAIIRRRVAVLEWSKVPSELQASLADQDAFQPVYAEGDAILVVLPEVRIEESRPKQRERIQWWLGERTDELVIEERENRYVIRPKSRRGEDALRLANQVHEELAPEMVQARMIRMVPRPPARRDSR